MTTEEVLRERSEAKCELCGSADGLSAYEVPPYADGTTENAVLVCGTCQSQIDGTEEMDLHHWRCLNESIWSGVPAVQVMAWRLLNRLKSESWATELLETLYIEESTLDWARAGMQPEPDNDQVKHIDSNGAVLSAGDTVVLTKDLNVKGASFTAKRGTAVRGISLVPDNAEQIEGRVNGQHIVILTKFVKKSG